MSGLLFRLTLACLLSATLSHPAAAQPPAELPSKRDLSRYGLKLQWWGQTVMDPRQDRAIHVTIDEDTVYVQTVDGIVTAFQGETGKRLWAQVLGAPNQVNLPVASNESEAFVAVGLELIALNKFTGEIQWELQLAHPPSTAPDADSDNVYVGMVDGSVFCYDMHRVRELWEEGRLPQWSGNACLWRHRTSSAITSTPISDGQYVVFASLTGAVYSVGANNRQIKFQFETDDPISTQMGRGAASLFVAAEDTRLYCLNLETGVRRWTFTVGVPIRTQVQVIGSNVFVSPQNDGLYCLTASTGVMKWHQPRATKFLAATNNYLFAGDELNNVLLLSHEDGGIEGDLPLRGFSKSVPNDRTDRLFLASPDGLILCIGEQGQEFPQYHKFPERRPILPEMAEDEPAEQPAAQ